MRAFSSLFCLIAIVFAFSITDTAYAGMTQIPNGCYEECEPEPEPESVPEPKPEGSGGNQGGHRGAGTRQLTRALYSMLEEALGLPHGTLLTQGESTIFLASTGDVSTYTVASADDRLFQTLPLKAKVLICKTQVMTLAHDDFREARLLMAVLISRVLDLPYALVKNGLDDPDFCVDTYQVRRSFYGPMARADKEPEYEKKMYFAVDTEGVPISSDPVWNACIRNTVIFDSTGHPFHCNRGRHHSGNHWYHPDFQNLEFTWNDRRAHPRPLGLPENVTIVVLDETDPLKLLAAAAVENKTLVARIGVKSKVLVAEANPEVNPGASLRVNTAMRRLNRLANRNVANL